MTKNIQVLVVEDDPYARDLMAILLARDWRTRVVGEFSSASEDELRRFFAEPAQRVDVMIVDTEAPGNEHWPMQIAQLAQAQRHPPALLYTCTRTDASLLERLPKSGGGGYIVKSEVLYALATAVSYAANGYFVITPQVQSMARPGSLPRPAALIDGSTAVTKFTQRENDLARLSVLFSMAQRDITDELVLSPDFVAEVIGQVYEKLGLHELLNGEQSPEALFTDKNLLDRIQSILPRDENGESKHGARKAPWMSTIAFHLLTVPEIEEMP